MYFLGIVIMCGMLMELLYCNWKFKIKKFVNFGLFPMFGLIQSVLNIYSVF